MDVDETGTVLILPDRQGAEAVFDGGKIKFFAVINIFDVDDFVRGTEWTKCYTPQPNT